MIAYTIIVLAAAERLGELIYAAHNTRALLAKGGVEIGRAHYPLFILLHTAWLVSIVLTLPLPAVVSWAALSAYLVLELLRVWTIGSLGPYWTTRIITLPNAPLVKRGPYRVVRHPNYLIVIGEIAVLPLVFGEIWVSVAFSLVNAALLVWRIWEENLALAPRRALPLK